MPRSQLEFSSHEEEKCEVPYFNGIRTQFSHIGLFPEPGGPNMSWLLHDLVLVVRVVVDDGGLKRRRQQPQEGKRCIRMLPNTISHLVKYLHDPRGEGYLLQDSTRALNHHLQEI